MNAFKNMFKCFYARKESEIQNNYLLSIRIFVPSGYRIHNTHSSSKSLSHCAKRAVFVPTLYPTFSIVVMFIFYVQGAAKIKNTDALKENDQLLEWLLKELFKIGRHPHPHSRQVNEYHL